MRKALEHITIIVCIVLFLAVIGFADGLSKAEPPNSVETAVCVSTADKQIQPVQTVRTQAYEPQYTYINRVPDDAQPVEIPEEEIIAVSKLLYGECRGIKSKTQQAGCAWVVCNRAKAWDMSIIEVITQKNQFFGFKESNPVTDELYELAKDVLTRYYSEYEGMPYSSGRVLPADYLWFTGVNGMNYFRNSYTKPYTIYDWSLESPYEK